MQQQIQLQQQHIRQLQHRQQQPQQQQQQIQLQQLQQQQQQQQQQQMGSQFQTSSTGATLQPRGIGGIMPSVEETGSKDDRVVPQATIETRKVVRKEEGELQVDSAPVMDSDDDDLETDSAPIIQQGTLEVDSAPFGEICAIDVLLSLLYFCVWVINSHQKVTQIVTQIHVNRSFSLLMLLFSLSKVCFENNIGDPVDLC